MMRVAGFLVAVCTVVAANAQTTVYPTGDAAHDVENVRAAVQAGGTVLLKATDAAGNPRDFNFGDFPVAEINWNDFGSGYVALGTHGEIVPLTFPSGFTLYLSFDNDVHLLGETVGASMTTIRGGTIPIRNFEPRAIPGAGTKIVYGLSNLRIEGIRFTESALQSIYTLEFSFVPRVLATVAARGRQLRTELIGNEFNDVQPAYDFFWYALAAVTDSPVGVTKISNNHVRFTPGRWDAEERQYEHDASVPRRPELWEGLSVADLRNPGEITQNEIQGVDVGVLVYFAGSDFVRVSDNRVELGPTGAVGIMLSANHRYLAERNTVIANGTFADGIRVWADDVEAGINDSTIRQNRVVTNGSVSGGIYLLGGGRNNYIGQNRVEGIGAFALGLAADFFGANALETGNVFAGNNITKFQPVESGFFPGTDVFFDVTALNNVLVGNSGTVLDLGQNNSLTGVPQKGAGVGPAMRDALAAKRDLLKRITRH